MEYIENFIFIKDYLDESRLDCVGVLDPVT